MQQNATPGELSTKQSRVLNALLLGSTVSSAAESGGVDRSTVYRWLKDDFVFQAELNRRRRDLCHAIERSLLATAVTAAETLRNAVEAGDVATSLQVLRGTGVLSGKTPPLGPEDPEVLRDEASIARAEADTDRELRKLLGSLP